MKYIVPKTLFVALLFCAPLCAQETLTEPERPVLNQMIRDLDHLTELIDTAERNRNQALRFQFDYDALRTDIERIREGISNHLDNPSRSARALAPISGEY